MKTLWEKEKMLATSIFIFSQNVLLPFQHHFPTISCHSAPFYMSGYVWDIDYSKVCCVGLSICHSGNFYCPNLTDKYSAYIAEVRAQNSRVFSLNLERECFLKVQFLYDDRPAERDTCMLVMLHKECKFYYSFTNKGILT